MATTSSWVLGTTENGTAVGNSEAYTLVHFGKAMPFISVGKPKDKKVPLDKKCIINAKKCKPTVSKQVVSSNYMKIPLKSSAKAIAEEITLSSDIPGVRSRVLDVKQNIKEITSSFKYGENVIIEVSNGSVDQLKIEVPEHSKTIDLSVTSREPYSKWIP